MKGNVYLYVLCTAILSLGTQPTFSLPRDTTKILITESDRIINTAIKKDCLIINKNVGSGKPTQAMKKLDVHQSDAQDLMKQKINFSKEREATLKREGSAIDSRAAIRQKEFSNKILKETFSNIKKNKK